MSAPPRELRRERLGPLAAQVVVDDDLRTFGRERSRAGGADSARAAGHEHPLSAQPRLHLWILSGMKVFVVSDMEGVAGIVKWQQTDGTVEKRSYHEGRELYTEEINAAVRGAKSAGATEIVVMDCHGAGGEWTFNSLIPDKLDPACEYVVQNDWTEYTELLEQGCDAALFVGMHAKAEHLTASCRTPSPARPGASSGSTEHRSGKPGSTPALCGQWGCPVLLVTGDAAVCREATELLGPGLTTVAVKKGLGRFSARQVPPLRARELIEEGAKKALSDLSAVDAYDPGRPAEIQIDFMTPDRLVEYRNRRGVEQIPPRPHARLARADDWWTAWSQFYF